MPAYADRARWVGMMQASIAMAPERFSSDRMCRDYFEKPLREIAPGAMTAVPAERVEHRTSSWLTRGFDAGLGTFGRDDLVYDDGGAPRRVTKEHFEHLVRKLKILRWLDRLDFESCLDLGAGSDFLPALVRERFGVDAYYADLVHRLNLPGLGSRLGKLDHAVTLDLTRLPFRDGAFDVVVSSEVLEHLVHPVEALAEMVRVARRAVVLTSLEALAPDRLRRVLSHLAIDVRRPHVERNFFLIDEFRALLGDDLRHEALLSYPLAGESVLAARAHRRDLRRDPRPRHAGARAGARRGAGAARAGAPWGSSSSASPPACRSRRPVPRRDAELARWLVNEVASLEYYAFADAVRPRRAAPCDRSSEPPGPAPDRPVAPALLARLQCPECRGVLVQDRRRAPLHRLWRELLHRLRRAESSIRRGRTTIAPHARRPCAGSAVTTPRARPRSCA